MFVAVVVVVVLIAAESLANVDIVAVAVVGLPSPFLLSLLQPTFMAEGSEGSIKGLPPSFRPFSSFCCISFPSKIASFG
jgi:hypothetical protein